MTSTPAPSITPSSSYQPEIDGLRAFAVLAVILHHFNAHWLPSGYLGVDIFFVISGFVITASLAGRRTEAGVQSGLRFLAEFYARRMKRLFPALLVCVAITSILICLFNPTPGASLETARTALWGQSNHYLLSQVSDYFAVPAKLNAFTQTWSLSVETQFYLVFPIVLWLTGFAQHRSGSTQRLGRFLLLLATVSLAGFVYYSLTHRPASAYFLMPVRFWELAAGSLLWLGKRSLPAWLKPELFLGLLGIIMFLPLQWIAPTTIAGVGLTLLLLLTLRPGSQSNRLLTQPWMVYIGQISYSLYLWHWTVLVLSRWTIGLHGWLLPLPLGLTIGLSMLSYHYVERPCRNARFRSSNWLKPVGLTLGIGLFSIWSLWSAIGSLTVRSPQLYLGSAQTPLVTPSPASYPACYLNANLEQQDPNNYATLPAECGLRRGGETATVYQLGDSHMEQFKNAIAHWATSKNQASIGVFGHFCQFPAVPRKRDLAGHITAQVDPCAHTQATLEANLRDRIAPGDTVFIGNALYAAFSGDWVDWVEDSYIDGQGHSISQTQALANYFQQLEQLTQHLTDRGASVVLLLDSAYFFTLLETHDAALCRPQWFRQGFSRISSSCTIPTQQFLANRQAIEDGLKAIAQHDRVYLWDTLDRHTCDDQVCTATHYVDSNHFTSDYAEYLFQTFRQQQPQIFGQP
jgi:peptidoglycan/LPS O-acetylase OafA/YrhL